MTTTGIPPQDLGFRAIGEFAGLFDTWPRGDRLPLLREAAEAYKQRFKAQGQVLGVRTVDLAAAPYLTAFAFHGAARSPNPYVSMINRMVVVAFRDFAGQPRTLVWEPTDTDGSAEAPFYAQLAARSRRNPFFRAVEKLYYRQYESPASALRRVGVRPEEVEYLSFDHLHVQDPRLVLPAFPNAKLLVQEREVATLRSLHPMQWAWYVEGGLDGVDPERLVLLDGDVELGAGVAIVATPGHTDGNHSLVLHTPDGVWVSSENGVSSDNWQPELSRIPGVRRYAQLFGREVCPNANTLEDSIDQYDSMVKEKALADPSPRDPRWRQVLPSSELVPWRRQWPVVPTHVHGPLSYGSLRP